MTRGAHRCDGCPAAKVGVVALCGVEVVAVVVFAADGVDTVAEDLSFLDANKIIV